MIIGQRVLPNARLSDDVGIWESSIVYEVLYLLFEAEAIVSFMTKFLMEVTIIQQRVLPNARLSDDFGI